MSVEVVVLVVVYHCNALQCIVLGGISFDCVVLAIRELLWVLSRFFCLTLVWSASFWFGNNKWRDECSRSRGGWQVAKVTDCAFEIFETDSACWK